MTSKLRLKRSVTKATPKWTTRSRTRCFTLEHKETSEDEDVGEEDADFRVQVTAGEGMANANSTRSNKGRLNKEPICVIMHKALLHQRIVPLPQDRPLTNHNNLATCAGIADITIAPSSRILQHFVLSWIGEGRAHTSRPKALSVGKSFTMVLMILGICLAE